MYIVVDWKLFKGMLGKKKNFRKLDMECLRVKWNNFFLNFLLNYVIWLDNFKNIFRNVKFLFDVCYFYC